MSVPWVCYTVFIIIALYNEKSLINMGLFLITLLLLFWHVTSDMVMSISHSRIIKGWLVYIIIAFCCFITILGFQMLTMP